MVRSILKSLCVVSLLSGYLLMAQSLAPRSRTDDLNQMVDHSSAEGTAENGLAPVVSAEAPSTLQAEVNASVNDERPFTPNATREDRAALKNLCASPDLTALAGESAASKERGHPKRVHVAGGSWQHCRLQTRGNSLAKRAAGAVRIRHTRGNLPGAIKNAVGYRARIAERGMYPGSLDPREAGGTYSRNFPDSTEGTALASPPDVGTVSPLEWQPNVDFSQPDFTERQFLKPSLQAGRRHGIDRRGDRANIFGRQRLESKPSAVLPGTGLPSNETSTPSEPSLLSPGDQQ